MICERFDGGPVGIEAVAASLSEERGTLEEVVEPFLLQVGFIARTPRGRVATAAGFQHMGLVAPSKAPTGGKGGRRAACSRRTVGACRTGTPRRAALEGFKFNQPYAKGLERLNDEVLAKTDFDPATLWQWGTMQAMALVGVLEGGRGEVRRTEGRRWSATRCARSGSTSAGRSSTASSCRRSITEAEFTSFYATVINRIVYASLEEPKIDGDGQGRRSTSSGARTRITTRRSTAACSATSCRG